MHCLHGIARMQAILYSSTHTKNTCKYQDWRTSINPGCGWISPRASRVKREWGFESREKHLHVVTLSSSLLEDRVCNLQLEDKTWIVQQICANNYASSLVAHIQRIVAMKLDVNGQVSAMFSCDQPCPSTYSSSVWSTCTTVTIVHWSQDLIQNFRALIANQNPTSWTQVCVLCSSTQGHEKWPC